MANYRVTSTFPGLQTWSNWSAPSTDTYVVQGTVSFPRITDGNTANSSVVVTVKQNSSTVLTTSAGQDGFYIAVNCTLGDTISIITSSAAAVDNVNLNTIKTTFQIFNITL